LRKGWRYETKHVESGPHGSSFCSLENSTVYEHYRTGAYLWRALILYINSLRPSVRLSDATVLHFNSPAEPACIFYGRTGSAGELKCRGRFSSPTNPGPKSQRPGFKDPNDKKKTWPGPGGFQVCGTGSVTKPGLPTKTRVPGHKPSSLPRVDRNRARVFPGLSPTPARVPELGHLSPFSL